VLAGLDSSRFRFDFRELSQGTDYEFRIHERSDVNYDGDTDDFFSFRRSKRERGIRFIDRSVKQSLEQFILEYSRVLDLRYETEQSRGYSRLQRLFSAVPPAGPTMREYYDTKKRCLCRRRGHPFEFHL
jgi:hypothetical protein